jgi:histidinol-phosphate aminotransferase
LQKYPEYGNLNEIIASYAGCDADQVMVTNGSDQGIDVVMRAFLEKGDKVVIPSPSFAMEYQSALVQGASILKPLYKEDMSFPLQEVMALLEQKPKLLVLVNPNNPTGTVIEKEDVQAMVQKAKDNNVAVLHDEAYFEFSGITAIELVQDFDNLFISRTLSKQFGLASLRAGYVVSQAQNIGELLKIRGPYDVNMPAAVGIQAALQDVGYAQSYIQEVMQESKKQVEAFFQEHNIQFFPGAANFLLVQPDNVDTIVQALKEQGILVRPRKDVPGTVRVSIGTKQDTKRFIQAYTALLLH